MPYYSSRKLLRYLIWKLGTFFRLKMMKSFIFKDFKSHNIFVFVHALIFRKATRECTTWKTCDDYVYFFSEKAWSCLYSILQGGPSIIWFFGTCCFLYLQTARARNWLFFGTYCMSNSGKASMEISKITTSCTAAGAKKSQHWRSSLYVLCSLSMIEQPKLAMAAFRFQPVFGKFSFVLS